MSGFPLLAAVGVLLLLVGGFCVMDNGSDYASADDRRLGANIGCPAIAMGALCLVVAIAGAAYQWIFQ